VGSFEGHRLVGDRATVISHRIRIGGFQDCVAEATSGLFERAARCFARRSHEKRDVGLRNGEAGRIDRRGERGFVEPPHEPSAEFLPLKAQRRPQARLEKPLALAIIEPRPALHRGVKQINASHLASYEKQMQQRKPQKRKLQIC